MFDIFAIHAGHVYDVIDTGCWVQNGSTHGHFFAYFQTSIFNKQVRKWGTNKAAP